MYFVSIFHWIPILVSIHVIDAYSTVVYLPYVLILSRDAVQYLARCTSKRAT